MKIVAVTACPNGVAHTYMSAVKLENSAKKLGFDISIEKQGSVGIEDRLTPEDITKADIVIIAASINIHEIERFSGKKIFRCNVALPIKLDELIFEEALNHSKIEYFDSREKLSLRKTFIKDMNKGFYTSLSMIMPYIIGATLLMCLPHQFEIWMGGMFLVESYDLIHYFNQLYNMLIQFAMPLFLALMAYSIAGRNGLAAGFTGAFLVTMLNIETFGAILIVLFGSTVTRFIVDKFRINGPANVNIVMFLAPMLSVMLTTMFAVFISTIPFFQNTPTVIDTSFSAKDIPFILFFALASTWDLGGKINKIAVFTGIIFICRGDYQANTIVQASMVIPALGYGFATIIRRKKFSDAYRKFGKNALILGMSGVAEGAMPFSMAAPKPYMFRIVNLIGCFVGCLLLEYFDVLNPIPFGGFLIAPLIDNGFYYIISVVIGGLTITMISLFLASVWNLHETKRISKD